LEPFWGKEEEQIFSQPHAVVPLFDGKKEIIKKKIGYVFFGFCITVSIAYRHLFHKVEPFDS
jgi:hypothetical protein